MLLITILMVQYIDFVRNLSCTSILCICIVSFFFFFENTMFFNTHKGREENILKKLTVVYI